MSPVNLDSAVVDLRMTIKVWIWCLSLLSTNFIHSNSLIDELSPRLHALISHLNIFTFGSDAYFRTDKIGAIGKFWASPFFFIFNTFLFFYSFFRFCFIFEGVALQLSGCSSVLLLFTNFPIYFRNSQNFHQFISNPPRFQCFIATMQVSSSWSSTFPKKSETFFA